MIPLPRRRLGLLAAALPPAPALAQPAWPSRPIRLVVPCAPGGGSDFLAGTLGAAIALIRALGLTLDG
jgi:tripartite-type tricarboxylate transporter receptor subunit TctC